jgi:hypothetical protein
MLVGRDIAASAKYSNAFTTQADHQNQLFLETRRGLQLVGNRVEETTIQSRIKSHAQLAMILIIQRDKPEGLHTSALLHFKGSQHFGHAANRA